MGSSRQGLGQSFLIKVPFFFFFFFPLLCFACFLSALSRARKDLPSKNSCHLFQWALTHQSPLPKQILEAQVWGSWDCAGGGLCPLAHHLFISFSRHPPRPILHRQPRMKDGPEQTGWSPLATGSLCLGLLLTRVSPPGHCYYTWGLQAFGVADAGQRLGPGGSGPQAQLQPVSSGTNKMVWPCTEPRCLPQWAPCPQPETLTRPPCRAEGG